MPLEVRDATPDDWPQVAPMLARAFRTEPFVPAMYGDDPIEQLAGLRALYDMTFDETRVNVVATIGDMVVGMAGAVRPGRCAVCDTLDMSLPMPTEPPWKVIDRQFDLLCRAAHQEAGLPPHARIGPVGSEPSMQGSGIGRAVVGGVVDRLRADGDPCIVLECIEHNEPFYTHLGFRRIGSFPDPAGSLTVVMRLAR